MSFLRRSPLLFAAAVLIVAGTLFAVKIHREMVDFAVNYAAGDRLIHGETLYRSTDNHYQFKYSPFCALIYAPLALLPAAAAKAVWFLVVILATAGIFFFTARIISEKGGRNAAGAVVGAGMILAKYFFREIQLGQINALITVLLLMMIAALNRDEPFPSSERDTAAGLFWGLAAALKPYALIFLPYFIIKRRWNVLWPAILVFGVSLIAPSFFYGFSGNASVHEEWISSLSRSTPGLLDSQDNVSLLAFLVKWTGDPGLSKLLYAGGVILLAGIVFFFIRRGRNLPNTIVAETGLLLLLIPLISPLGWDYTFISSFPAVALILRRAREFPTAGRILMGLNFAVIALSLYDVMGRRAYSAFMSASVLTLNFLVLVGFLCYLRWTRKA